eukprot:5525800-Prorocentrum_lima.AAC.1
MASSKHGRHASKTSVSASTIKDMKNWRGTPKSCLCCDKATQVRGSRLPLGVCNLTIQFWKIARLTRRAGDGIYRTVP